jgi:hypothetical protein
VHFERKKTKTRWISSYGCRCCASKIRQVPNDLKLPQSDRKHYRARTSPPSVGREAASLRGGEVISIAQQHRWALNRTMCERSQRG